MPVDLVLPLIALAVALFPPASSPVPEAPMPTIDPATGLEVPDATLGGPTDPGPDAPTADPVAVPDPEPATPDSPPPPGTTNPDTGADDGTGPTAVPTPTPTGTDPATPAGPRRVAARDVITRGAQADKQVSDLEKAQAEINARLADAYKAQEAADKGISAVVGTNPDGFLSKDADGKVILITKTSSGKGYNVTHPSSDEELVDDPTAAS